MLHLKIIVKDSLPNDGRIEFWVGIVKDYLEYKYKKNLNEEDAQRDCLPQNNHQMDASFPKQLNSDDCGVFTCIGLNYLLLGLTPDFTANDSPLLRAHIARALLRNNLEHGPP